LRILSVSFDRHPVVHPDVAANGAGTGTSILEPRRRRIMKHPLPVLLVLGMASVFSPASRSDPPMDRAAIELQDVQKALLAGAEALERNDADALQRYYSSEWLSVSPSGAALASGKGFSGTRSGELHYDSIKVTDPITRVHGRSAVSTSRVTVKGSNKGHDISGVYRVTTMLANEYGGWKIVALVSSPVDAEPASK
jgi:ketosteroid isomerase-like protein